MKRVQWMRMIYTKWWFLLWPTVSWCPSTEEGQWCGFRIHVLHLNMTWNGTSDNICHVQSWLFQFFKHMALCSGNMTFECWDDKEVGFKIFWVTDERKFTEKSNVSLCGSEAYSVCIIRGNISREINLDLIFDLTYHKPRHDHAM